MKKILLAYSGGLDTSCILTWLKENYNAEIIAYCADVGQEEDFDAVVKKAIATGASKCIVDNLQDQFVKNYIFPAIQTNALYEGVYLMGTSLARPCIATGMVTAALKEGCYAIAHGATGKGNDQVRFELAMAALAPQLEVIAPWRTWSFNGRTDLFEYAEKHGIPLPVTKDKPYSIDANLMHISYEGGVLEDPWAEPPKEMFVWTTDPQDAPDEPEQLTIEFTGGVPTGLNGQAMAPVELLKQANAIAGKHGVGRVDTVENRFIGIKSRGVYETPGCTIIAQAHRAIESITLDREVAHMKDSLVPKISELIYNGYWFSPETQLLLKMINESQETVTGTVKLKLYKGSSIVTGRKAQNSLYNKHMTSFDDMTAFNPSDSTGFINISALRLKAWSQAQAKLTAPMPVSKL